MDDLWQDQKNAAGRFATLSWLAIGAYLFWSRPAAKFLSWQALVYFPIGMFVAAVVFGWLIYRLQRLTSKLLVRLGGDLSLSAMKWIGRLGSLIKIFSFIVIYVAAARVVELLHAAPP